MTKTPDLEAAKLLPCPFCGKAGTKSITCGRAIPNCPRCSDIFGCDHCDVWFETAEEWNTRAQSSKPSVSGDAVETEKVRGRRFSCCEKERRHLICSGRSLGVGSPSTSESVYICLSCGQFEVRLSENDVHLSTRFHIWSDAALDAACKPFNRVADEDGKPHYHAAVTDKKLSREWFEKLERLLNAIHEDSANSTVCELATDINLDDFALSRREK